MNTCHEEYLGLLRDVGAALERLAVLEEKKAAVIRQDDLLGLDEVLKQEQALGLNLRGLELKRQKLAPQLGLDSTKLEELVSQFPPELELKARDTVRELKNSYKIYRSCSDMARNTLELNLHQIEKVITAAGGDPKELDVGYQAPGAEPPRNMKTDFRA